MTQSVELSTIEFGRDNDSGARIALVKFAVIAESDPLPNPQDFTVQIVLLASGDVAETVSEARRRFHRLAHDLAVATEGWDRAGA